MDMQMAGVVPQTSKLRVKFFTQAVLNPYKTAEEGRPIHDSVVFIEKLVPGAESSFIREKWDKDERDFPDAWRAFLEQREIPRTGTRLEDWGQLSCEQIADLKAQHVFTLEELEVMDDAQVDNLGLGGRDLRTRAQAYLRGAKDKNYAAQLAGKVTDLERELVEMKAIAEAQAAELKALREERPRKK